MDLRDFRLVTIETVLAEARIRAEAASPSPRPERLAVLVDEYIAAQLQAADRERRRQLCRARTDEDPGHTGR